MGVQVENMEKNMAQLTIEVPVEDFEKAIEKTYQKSKNRFNVPGFRKGKVPRKMIEKMYGVGVFYEDAVNDILPGAYEEAAEESGLDIVSQPQINVAQVEAGKPVVFTALVAVKPEVKLGDYKGLEVEAADLTVTSDEVKEVLKQEQEKNATLVLVERAAKKGDTAVIDYEGFCDGVAFKGGKGSDHSLVLGSGQFIPGFEDQLIGKKAGQEVDVNVTFPKPYQSKDLEGKEAVFKVTVKEVKAKELPKLDDEFAGEVSEFETLKEYKADIKKKLADKKAKDEKAKKEDALINLAVENAEMEIPDAMVQTEARSMLNEFSNRLQQQGMKLEQYMQFTGMNQQKMMEQMKEQALKKIETLLVLEAIAVEEAIEVSEEEMEENLAKMAESYKLEVEQLKGFMDDASMVQIKKDMATQKALELLVENSKEVPAAAKEEKTDN